MIGEVFMMVVIAVAGIFLFIAIHFYYRSRNLADVPETPK